MEALKLPNKMYIGNEKRLELDSDGVRKKIKEYRIVVDIDDGQLYQIDRSTGEMNFYKKYYK